MRSYFATGLVLAGILALLWSAGLGPQAAVSLAKQPPRPTLTPAPPTPIPPTAEPATATPEPRQDDDDDDDAAMPTPTLTPTSEAIATPAGEPTPTATPLPSPTEVAPAAPPQLPRTGADEPAGWPLALLGLALIGLGLRLFRVGGGLRERK